MRRLALFALAVTAAGLAPGAAEARRYAQPLVDLPPASPSFRDAVIPPLGREGHAIARAADTTFDFKPYTTKEGYTIPVAISSRYANPDPAIAQSYVDFLDGLAHSTELRKLDVYLAPPDEVLSLCGNQPGTLACYASGPELMVVPGEQTDAAGGVTTSYVITHEYGHHIANNRTNPPFDAFQFGPKFWSSYEMVCNRSQAGLLFPGDEGANYDKNPGEGWAETYAHMVYRDQPWVFSDLMKPDEGAFAAAAKDISDLWHANRTKVFKGSFGRRGSSTRTFSVALSLDGSLSVSLKGPKASNYDIGLRSAGGAHGATRAPGSRDHLSYSAACRSKPVSRLTIAVHRRRGAGPFRLTVSYAG